MLRIGLGNRLDPALAGQGIDAGEAPVDPLGKLAGGLTREGQTQDLVAADDAVDDEPHDPCRHRLGLAAAGPRHHQDRRQRRLDDALLRLGGRGQLEKVGDLQRRQPRHGKRAARSRSSHGALTGLTVCSRHTAK